jgi:tetratricopeptide (TPR) repeat protein
VLVYRRLLDGAIEASQLCPGDIHYRHWLNYYRWKYISQSRDPETGQLLLSDQQLQWSRRVVAELLAGVRQCPTYGPSYSLAGQIEMNVLNNSRGAGLVRAGWRLSQADPGANFEAGLLDAREGNWEAALKKLRHAGEIDISGAYLNEAVETLARDLRRPDWAVELAGQNVQAVRRIARVLQASGQTEAAETVNQHLAELVKSLAAAPNASRSALTDAATLAMQQRDFSAAAKYLRRALSFDFADADLRLSLAQALAEMGQIAQALEEAQTAERLGSQRASSIVLELKQRLGTQPASGPTR